MSSTSGMARSSASICSVMSCSTSSGFMPGNWALTTTSRMRIGGSSWRGKFMNSNIPATITIAMNTMVRREASRPKRVIPFMTSLFVVRQSLPDGFESSTC